MLQTNPPSRLDAVEAWRLLITALSFFVAAFAFFQKVLWDKKHYAMEIVKEWDEQTAAHREAIECRFPALQQKNSTAEFSEAVAIKVYEAHEGDDLRLRQHIVSLLNHLEFISVAYKSKAANRDIIERTLTNPLIKWNGALAAYIKIDTQRSGRPSWTPYEELAEYLGKKRVKASVA